MLFGEVVVIRLNAEVLVYLSLLSGKETFYFLNACLLNKELLVFQLGAVIGIVSHQIFTQEDARVETFANA